MKRITTMFATLALLLPLAAVAAPQPGGGDGPGMGPGGRHGGPGADGRMDRGRHLERMMERLDLSESQRERIAGIRAGAEEDRVANRKQMVRLRHEVRGEMLKDAPNRQAVVRLTRQIGELRTKMDVQRIENRLAIREVLTPEQRDRLMAPGARGGREWSGPRRSPRGGPRGS